MAEPAAVIVSVADPIAEAARRVAEAVQNADRASGSARLAISGGSAAAAVGPVRRALEPAAWRRVRLTWADERCVPFGHPDSNRGGAHRAGLLDPRDPPAIELGLFSDGESPEQARARVAAAIEKDFGGAIDVALLGMGEDGHVASLFAGHAALQDRSPVAVVSDSPKPPPLRMTLTLPLLRTATATVLLVTGEAKRDAIRRLGRGDATLPAARLGHVVVVTDLAL